MLHIGVTGGIGSGKTTFLKAWEQLGAEVIYADPLARELMVSDERLRNEIIIKFGEDAYQQDGSLNKDKLAEEAFEKGRISELNALVHPVVHQAISERKQQAGKKGGKLFAHESALLLESESIDMCDVIIMLVSPREERIRRITERDNTDESSVQQRMNNQPDFDALVDRADLVIHNDSTVQQLEKKAEEVYNELMAIEKTRRYGTQTNTPPDHT